MNFFRDSGSLKMPVLVLLWLLLTFLPQAPVFARSESSLAINYIEASADPQQMVNRVEAFVSVLGEDGRPEADRWEINKECTGEAAAQRIDAWRDCGNPAFEFGKLLRHGLTRGLDPMMALHRLADDTIQRPDRFARLP